MLVLDDVNLLCLCGMNVVTAGDVPQTILTSHPRMNVCVYEQMLGILMLMRSSMQIIAIRKRNEKGEEKCSGRIFFREKSQMSFLRKKMWNIKKILLGRFEISLFEENDVERVTK